MQSDSTACVSCWALLFGGKGRQREREKDNGREGGKHQVWEIDNRRVWPFIEETTRHRKSRERERETKNPSGSSVPVGYLVQHSFLWFFFDSSRHTADCLPVLSAPQWFNVFKNTHPHAHNRNKRVSSVCCSLLFWRFFWFQLKELTLLFFFLSFSFSLRCGRLLYFLSVSWLELLLSSAAYAEIRKFK